MSFSFRGRGQVSRQISFQQYGGRRGQDQIIAFASDFLSTNPAAIIGGGTEPSLATTLTANSAAHTFGAWTEIHASTSFDVSALRIITDAVAATTVATGTIIDIGVGSSGSEISVAQIAVGSHSSYVTMLPVYVPTGSRIAGRIQSVVTGGKTASVRVGLIPTIGDFRPATYVDVYGVDLATSRGLNVPSGTGWTQVTASTTRAYRMVSVVWSASNTTQENRNIIGTLAIGAGGSEVAIGYSRARSTAAEAVLLDSLQSPFLYVGNIPAGSRLALRTNMATSATADYFDVTLIGIP